VKHFRQAGKSNTQKNRCVDFNASTPQHLNASTPQHLNASTPQRLNASTPQRLNILIPLKKYFKNFFPNIWLHQKNSFIFA